MDLRQGYVEEPQPGAEGSKRQKIEGALRAGMVMLAFAASGCADRAMPGAFEGAIDPGA